MSPRITKPRFFEAVADGDDTAVARMLDERPKLIEEVVTSGPTVVLGMSALGLAVYVRQWPTAALLLERGADVDHTPDPEWVRQRRIREWCTPLQLAIVKMIDVSEPGRAQEEVGVQLVLQMIAASRDLQKPGSDGLTALHMVCTLLHRFHESTRDFYLWAIERVCAALLDAGTDPHLGNELAGSPAELYAADSPVARRLLRLE